MSLQGAADDGRWYRVQYHSFQTQCQGTATARLLLTESSDAQCYPASRTPAHVKVVTRLSAKLQRVYDILG